MTEVEQRLRQELRDIAQRVAPDDLRPLREPPPRPWTVRARWLAPLGAASAVAGVVVGLSLAGPAATSGPPTFAWAPMVQPLPAAPDPAVVAVADKQGQVILLSPVTGRVIRTLNGIGADIPGAMAFTPDSRTMFASGLRGNLEIGKVQVPSGKTTPVAAGDNPAVSPDGRYLAYAGGGGLASLVVRDLRGGGTRYVDLSGLIGGQPSLASPLGLTWLGNGSQVLAIPNPAVTVEALGSPSAHPLRKTHCGSQDSPRGLCVIVVTVARTGLSAHPVFVPGSPARYVGAISGYLRARQSFLIARTSPSGPGAVEEVSLAGTSVVVRQLAALPVNLVQASIAPDGDRVVYVLGNSPQVLWVAVIRHGQLVGKRRLTAARDTPVISFVSW